MTFRILFFIPIFLLSSCIVTKKKYDDVLAQKVKAEGELADRISELEKANAFVAAWLPGSEGQGIADVLFGDVDFSGKLSFTWPKNIEQLPINVGDENYDPLFPYGYGLTYKK